jgi:hypothetical protein
MRLTAIRWSALALAGLILCSAQPALAKAEKAKDQRSIDLLRDKFKKDKEEDKKGPKLSPEEAAAESYRKGTLPLTAWAPLVKIIRNAKAESRLRDRLTGAILDRLRMERGRGTDNRVLSAIKKQIANEMLPLIMADDKMSQQCVHRLLTAWWPNSGINAKPGQGKRARRKAYNAWKKQLN